MSKIRFALVKSGGARCVAMGLSMMCCVSAGSQAWAASPAVDEGQASPEAETVHEAQAWPEADTVRMLLRADAAAALADCKMPGVCQSAAPSSDASAFAAGQQDDIRVAAIFGSTKRLSIDVLINGAMLRYRAGHGAPVAGTLKVGEYRLLAVDGACVHLRRGDHDHTACLNLDRDQP